MNGNNGDPQRIFKLEPKIDACPVVQLAHGKKQIDEEKGGEDHRVHTMNMLNRRPQSAVEAN